MKAVLVPVLLVAIGCGAKVDDQPGPSASETAAEPVGSEVAAAASSDVAPPTSGSAPDHSEPDYSVKGPKDNPDPHIARQAALRDAAQFGMMGLLNSGAGGDPNAPTVPWGRDDSLSKDAISARGNMWGDQIGDSFGAGGLGLSGIGKGEGGGGRGEGIGLGNIGTLGHGGGTGTGQGFGSGSGRLSGVARTKPPSVRMGATSVSGRLPPEVIQRIVRQNFGRFRLCYENGLRTSPNLQGQVTVSFVIGTEGNVSSVSAKTDMSDAAVSSCVSKAFNGLTFPKPEGGVVKVTYPINFSPGESSSSTAKSDLPSNAAPAEPVLPKKIAGPTIAGKALADVTALEIEKALRDAGYTEISSSSKPNSKAVVFSAKKGTRVFTLTLVPPNAPADALTTNEKNRLNSEAKVFASGGLFLAVESDDKAASQLLLDSIIKKP